MLMIQSTIDHIVIGAADLEKATKRIEQFIKADFSDVATRMQRNLDLFFQS